MIRGKHTWFSFLGGSCQTDSDYGATYMNYPCASNPLAARSSVIERWTLGPILKGEPNWKKHHRPYEYEWNLKKERQIDLHQFFTSFLNLFVNNQCLKVAKTWSMNAAILCLAGLAISVMSHARLANLEKCQQIKCSTNLPFSALHQ